MPSIRRTGKRREIAQRIRRRRLQLSLRQEDVSKPLRIDRQQWADIENGKQSLPIERLAEVCEILKLTPMELLGAVAQAANASAPEIAAAEAA